eukprot:213281-Amphidinium_carterae.1
MPKMPARFRLRRESFSIQGQSEAYDQQQPLQEFIRRSYIQYHPTSGYDKAREEMKPRRSTTVSRSTTGTTS